MTPSLAFKSPPVPNASILFCGMCGAELHRDLPDDCRPTEVVWAEAEAACAAHLEAEHSVRYWLWKRLGWRWLVAGLAE